MTEDITAVKGETDGKTKVRPEGSEEGKKKGCCGRLWTMYDRLFLVQLALQYSAQGTRMIIFLALQLTFYNDYGMEPAEVQGLIAAITLTWFPKLLYGIISDTFPIMGSRRKSYCVLLSGVMIIGACMNIFIENEESHSTLFLGTAIMLFCLGFMDVVVDGLIINQQKIDPVHGSEDLTMYAWICYAAGGSLITIAAMIILAMNDNDVFFVWILLLLLGISLFCSSLYLSMDLEKSNEKINNAGFCTRIKENYRQVCKGLQVKGVLRLLLFLCLAGSIVPNYDDYLVQYM
jgi:MFS family permease